MADWQKTKYRLGPKPDPLAEAEDFKYVGAALLIGAAFFGGIGLLAYWLLTL